MAYTKTIALKNGTNIKRHFYNKKHYYIDKKNKVVRLVPEFYQQLLNKKLWGKFGYKKIGGSSIGNVTGSNTFGSKFAESCRIMWINMPIFDKKYINAGIIIEPKIISAMNKTTGENYETYPGEEYDFDFFSSHPFIGGLPDTTIKEKKKMYELKTTGEKNLDKWEKFGVPENYKQQVALYDYLMFGKKNPNHTFKPKIVACFLKQEDYIDPNSVNINERKIKSYDVNYNIEEVEGWISQSKKFRDTIMKNNCSYPFDEEKDKQLLSYLECSNEDEFIEWLKKEGMI